MEKVTCIKSVETKKGLKFEKGNSYEYSIYNDGIVINIDYVNSIKIKSENSFNKYFKF